MFTLPVTVSTDYRLKITESYRHYGIKLTYKDVYDEVCYLFTEIFVCYVLYKPTVLVKGYVSIINCSETRLAVFLHNTSDSLLVDIQAFVCFAIFARH